MNYGPLEFAAYLQRKAAQAETPPSSQPPTTVVPATVVPVKGSRGYAPVEPVVPMKGSRGYEPPGPDKDDPTP